MSFPPQDPISRMKMTFGTDDIAIRVGFTFDKPATHTISKTHHVFIRKNNKKMMVPNSKVYFFAIPACV